MNRPRTRMTLIAAALAAMAAPALAAESSSPLNLYYHAPSTTYYTPVAVETPGAVIQYDSSSKPLDPLPAPVITAEARPAPVVTYSYPAGTLTYEPTTTTTVYTSPAPEYYAAPPITVTAPRLNEDQAITAEVVDTLASDPRLSGRIGVETYRNDVTLTGRVTTPRQVELAASDARSVPGMREVNNQLRSRVGNF